MRPLSIEEIVEFAKQKKPVYLVDLLFEGGSKIFPLVDYYIPATEYEIRNDKLYAFRMSNGKCMGIYYLASDYGRDWIAYRTKADYQKVLSSLKKVGYRGFIGVTVSKTNSGFYFEFAFDGHRVARASLVSLNSSYFLHDFVVEDCFRGMGFGTKIFSYLNDHYKINSLNVAKDNNVARHLYEKFGFKVDSDCLMENGEIYNRMRRN